MKCPVCGRENFEPNNFCYNCGYCLNSSLKSVKHMRRDRSGYIAAIILLALICIGLAATLVHFGLKYRTMVSENRAARAEQAAAEQALEEVEARLYIPYDGSYVYHRYGCSLLDPSVPLYIMDEDEAIAAGCTPCPDCIK